MMRICVLLTTSLLVWFSHTAHATPQYGMAGCGLGSLVIKDDGFMQVFAATTNGTSNNQLFGITSGTSNCLPASQMAALQRQESFIASNLTTLRTDMVRGEGETLEAFAEVLGCEESVRPEFRQVATISHQDFFAAPGAYATLHSVKQTLRNHPVLNDGCKLLI